MRSIICHCGEREREALEWESWTGKAHRYDHRRCAHKTATACQTSYIIHGHKHCTAHFHKHEHCAQRLHHADGRRWQEEEMAVKEQSHDRKRKWPLKNGHMTEKTKALQTTNVTENLVWKIVVICLVVERGSENACMAFCTWNKTLKGNTPVYRLCAPSIDSRLQCRETWRYEKVKMLLRSLKPPLVLPTSLITESPNKRSGSLAPGAGLRNVPCSHDH